MSNDRKKHEKNAAARASLAAHVERGEAAIALLEKIWVQVDHYSIDWTVDFETARELQKFFNFDDSE